MYFHNTISSITFIMQSLKQCFEVKHRKTKGGRRFIYFQIVENHMYVFIYIYFAVTWPTFSFILRLSAFVYDYVFVSFCTLMYFVLSYILFAIDKKKNVYT